MEINHFYIAFMNFTLKWLHQYNPQMEFENWLQYKPKVLKELRRVAYSMLGADDSIVMSHVWFGCELMNPNSQLWKSSFYPLPPDWGFEITSFMSNLWISSSKAVSILFFRRREHFCSMVFSSSYKSIWVEATMCPLLLRNLHSDQESRM